MKRVADGSAPTDNLSFAVASVLGGLLNYCYRPASRAAAADATVRLCSGTIRVQCTNSHRAAQTVIGV
jgi:hypothetical protein